MNNVNKFLTAALLSISFNSEAVSLVEYNFNNYNHHPSNIFPEVDATNLEFVHIGQSYDNQTLNTKSWNRGGSIYRYFEFSILSQGDIVINNLTFQARRFSEPEDSFRVGHNNLAYQIFSEGIQVSSGMFSLENNFTNFSFPQTLIPSDNYTFKIVSVPGFSDWNVEFDNIAVDGNVFEQQAPNEPSAVPEVNNMGIIIFGVLGLVFLRKGLIKQ